MTDLAASRGQVSKRGTATTPDPAGTSTAGGSTRAERATTDVPSRKRSTRSTRRRTPHPSPVALTIGLMALLLVAGAVAGLFVGRAQAPSYRSSEQALIQQWSVESLVLNGQATQPTAEDRFDASVLVTSDDVLSLAVTTLAEPGLTVEGLRSAVTAAASPTARVVTIDATGSSANEAEARVQAVAGAFVSVAKDKVLGFAQRLSTLGSSDTTAAATAAGASTIDPDEAAIMARAALAVRTVEPVTLYPIAGAEQTSIGSGKSMAAGGVLGLAVAALIVVGFSFSQPRVQSASDLAQHLLLPTMEWNGADDDNGIGMAADLQVLSRRGLVAICPATTTDVDAATALVGWLSAYRSPADDGGSAMTPAGSNAPAAACGIVAIQPPAAGLAAARPAAGEVAALVVVAGAGRSVADVEQAVTALASWRAADAVIIASPAGATSS